MQEVEETLVKRAVPATRPIDDQQINQVLIVDSRLACMQEAGDLLKAGVDPASMLEIGELVSRKEGQSQPQSEISSSLLTCFERNSYPSASFTGPITMFKSVGVGVQDVIITKEVVSHAKNMGMGTLIERYDTAF